MFIFGLQNGALLRLKSVPTSTHKRDLEKRGFRAKTRSGMVEDGRGCARAVDYAVRVGGEGAPRKSTEIFRI